MQKKIFSTVEVAKMFNVTSNTIKSWIREYKLNCLVSEGGHYKLTEEHVAEIKKIILKKYNLLEE